MNRRSLWLILTSVAVLGSVAMIGYRLVNRHQLAGSHIPAPPSLDGLPSALAEFIETAESKARGWRRPAEGLAELGRLYHSNGFYPQALICYEGLQLIEPADARWPHLQASIIADFGRMDEALPLRRKAVALAPDYIPARLRLGDVLLKANHVDEAAQTYADVLRRSANDPYALLGLARCDLANGNWTKAREHLQQAVAQHPDFIGALSLLVTVNEHFGDKLAADSLRSTIGRREFTDLPDPWLDDLAEVCFDSYRLSVAAAIANSAGHGTTAVNLLDQAIALSPNVSSYRRQAGQMLLNGHNYAGAKIHLEKAVEINPADSDAWLHLFNTLRGLGQDQAALNALMNGLAHCPQSPSLHLEHARWLQSTGRLEEAAAEFRHGYELRPSDASALVELAGVYFALGRDVDALAVLNLALERQPDHPMALATHTFYAISQHDEPTALRWWGRVRNQVKTPPAVVDGLRHGFLQQFGHELP